MKKLIRPGRIVMAFKTSEDAGRAREKVLADRFAENEIRQWTKVEAVANLTPTLGKVMSLPYQVAEKKLFALAQQGSGFLVVHARSESESQRAVALVRDFGLQLAEKYNRFTIEEMAA